MRKTNRKFSAICSAIASGCFGIVSYGNFTEGNQSQGWLFGALACAQFALAAKYFRDDKKAKEPPVLTEEETAEQVSSMTMTDIL